MDFYCASANVAIELDGGVHDLPAVREHDVEREQGLTETFGVRFVRLRNEFVLGASDAVIQSEILRAISGPAA